MTSGRRGGGGDDDPVVLGLSGFFVVSAVASPLALLVLGGWGLVRAGELRTFPLVLVGVGLVLGVAVLVDLPFRVVFGPGGVDRVCPLRRQHVDWDDVMALGRTRVDRGGQRLVGRVAGDPATTKRGGLVLLVGPKRRRYLLTDRQERPDQYDELRRRLGRWAPGLPLPDGPR